MPDWQGLATDGLGRPKKMSPQLEMEQQSYRKMGYVESENLVTSRDDDNGSLESVELKRTAMQLTDLPN